MSTDHGTPPPEIIAPLIPIAAGWIHPIGWCGVALLAGLGWASARAEDAIAAGGSAAGLVPPGLDGITLPGALVIAAYLLGKNPSFTFRIQVSADEALRGLMRQLVRALRSLDDDEPKPPPAT